MIPAFRRWCGRFQKWVAAGNRNAIAAAIDFPLRVVKTKAKFLARYDQLFNDQVRRAVRDQNLNQIWRNYQGAMFGRGALWFGQRNDRFMVIAINP